MQKEDKYAESSGSKTEMLIETLAEEILTVGLRQTESENQNVLDRCSIFGWSDLSSFSCEELFALIHI